MRSLLLSSTASAAGFLLLLCALSSPPRAAAQIACTVTYDCAGNSGCAGVMGGNVTQRSLSYASQSACDSAAAEAQHGLPNIKCSCGGGGSTDTSGNIGSLISTMTPQQQMGTAIGLVGATMMLQGFSELMHGKPAPLVDPAQQQRNLAAQQLNNSGIYLLRQKNYSGAINEFEKALAQTPNDANILNNLALAKRQQKNAEAAGSNSNSLGQLLGVAPVNTANSGSALNLVNLDRGSSPNANYLHGVVQGDAVDMSGTTKTSVDPNALKSQIDGVFGTIRPAAAPPDPRVVLPQVQDIELLFQPPATTPPLSGQLVLPQSKDIELLGQPQPKGELVVPQNKDMELLGQPPQPKQDPAAGSATGPHN